MYHTPPETPHTIARPDFGQCDGALSALIAAWTRASASFLGRPGGIMSPKRMVVVPACFTKLSRGHSPPPYSATGPTGRPSDRYSPPTPARPGADPPPQPPPPTRQTP